MDGAQWEPCASPNKYEELAEGEHVFEVRAASSDGVTGSSPAKYVWLVDSALPRVLVETKPNKISDANSASFVFSCTKAECSFKCSIDGGELLPCASPWNVAELSEGKHQATIEVYVQEGQRKGESFSYEWLVDLSAPNFLTFSVVSEGESGYGASPTRGEFASIAVGSDGVAHLAYYDSDADDLRYATNPGGVWRTEILSAKGNVGTATSLVLDADSKVHIFFRDETNKDLKHISNKAGAWAEEVIDAMDDTGYCPSARLAPDGKPAVAFVRHVTSEYEPSYQLRFASGVLGPWVSELVDMTSGGLLCGASLAFDTGGLPHVVYGGGVSFQLKHAMKSLGNWAATPIPNSLGASGNASAAFDKQGNLHVSHYGAGVSYSIRSAFDGSWTTGQVIGGYWGRDGSGLATAPDGSVDMAYSGNLQEFKVYYRTNASGAWLTDTLDDKDGGRLSLAVDKNVKAHIAYYRQKQHHLAYVTNLTGPWLTTVVDGAGMVGEFVRVARDKDGYLHFIYYGRSAGQIRDIYSSGSQTYLFWPAGSNGVVDVVGSTGEGLSVVGEKTGVLHAAYFDSKSGDLRYASNASGKWQPVTVDSDGDVGRNPALDVEVDGSVFISYYDASKGDLKIAERQTGSEAWSVGVIDADGDVGKYSSLRVGQDGRVHIAYYDSSKKRLRYAVRENGSWTTSAFESEAGSDIGMWPSLDLGPDGVVHITYCNATKKDMLYAYGPGKDWKIESVDFAGDVGSHGFMRTDNLGFVHVTYRDETNGALKYATNRRGKWEIVQVQSKENAGLQSSFVIGDDGVLDAAYYAASTSAVVHTRIQP
ncbi:MAG: hypothetical protein HYT87_05760 [Nitrospirae bacterium]|nr:hypothetical protein [Nitrospirota bacterium]